MPTRRRSRSSGRHINSPRNGSTRRSGSRGRSRGKSNVKNASELPLPLPPLALPLTPVIGNKSLTYMNYLLQEHRAHANEVRTPGGTVVANYRKKLSPEYLPEYPTSYNSDSYNEPTSAEMRRYSYATEMFNNPIQPVRTRSGNRSNYNVGAYRRNMRRLQRRESF